MINATEWLPECLKLCVNIYTKSDHDNENGFVKVAEIKNDIFRYTNGYRPKWLSEFEGLIESKL